MKVLLHGRGLEEQALREPMRKPYKLKKPCISYPQGVLKQRDKLLKEEPRLRELLKLALGEYCSKNPEKKLSARKRMLGRIKNIGNADLRIKVLDFILKVNPADDYFQSNLSSSLINGKEYVKAARLFVGLKRSAKYVETYNSLATNLLVARQYDKGLEALLSLPKDKWTPRSFRLAADLYHFLNRPEKVLSILNQLKEKFWDRRCFMRAAHAAYNLKKYELAMVFEKKLLEVFPQRGFNSLMPNILRHLKKHEDAIRFINRQLGFLSKEEMAPAGKMKINANLHALLARISYEMNLHPLEILEKFSAALGMYRLGEIAPPVSFFNDMMFFLRRLQCRIGKDGTKEMLGKSFVKTESLQTLYIETLERVEIGSIRLNHQESQHFEEAACFYNNSFTMQ